MHRRPRLGAASCPGFAGRRADLGFRTTRGVPRGPQTTHGVPLWLRLRLDVRRGRSTRSGNQPDAETGQMLQHLLLLHRNVKFCVREDQSAVGVLRPTGQCGFLPAELCLGERGRPFLLGAVGSTASPSVKTDALRAGLRRPCLCDSWLSL